MTIPNVTVADLPVSVQGLVPTAVKTGPYTATTTDFVPVDISGGSVTITLPTAPADRTRIGVKVVAVDGSHANTCTIARGGSDVFNITAGATSLTLSALFQGVLLQYKTSGAIWYVSTADTPMNTPLGAPKLGTDNTVGGPGGSALSTTVGFGRQYVDAAPYVLYVDKVNGNDANLGNSEGRALQNLETAVALMNRSTHGGKIVVTGPGGGPHTFTRPAHLIQPCSIEAVVPVGAEIDRGFGTPNSRSVWDAITTAGGSQVQSATAAFTNADNGRIVSIYGAGYRGATYYDFISGNPPDGTHANLTATTSEARPAAFDLAENIKLTICGDWNRVVTDAAIASGASIITSATAAWTNSDIGTEVMIAGAGQAGQALRGTIKSVQSATQCTLLGAASNTVTGARCAIGVNFGDLLHVHVPNCGLKFMYLWDPSTGQNRIGSAFKMSVDDGYVQSSGQFSWRDNIVSNSDPASAWESIIDIDGTWSPYLSTLQSGVRKSWFHGGTLFGARSKSETIRIAGADLLTFIGGGGGGPAPAATAQGIKILDPQRTGSPGSSMCAYVFFSGFAGNQMYFYSEGTQCGFDGGQIGWNGARLNSRYSIQLSPVCSTNSISTQCTDLGSFDMLDQGAHNRIDTNRTADLLDYGSHTLPYTLNPSPNGTRAGTLKIVCTSAGALGVPAPVGIHTGRMLLLFDITNSSGGVITVTWSSNFKQSYVPPADGARNLVAFHYDHAGDTWYQVFQSPDFVSGTPSKRSSGVLLQAPAFSATGLTGAVTPSRFVGATAAGAPVSGTFIAGDYVLDLSGTFWICTVGGTPGTWVQVGAAAASSLGTWAPTNYGLLLWACDPALMSTGASPVAAGVLHLDMMYVPSAVTFSKLWLNVGTVGNTLANSFAGVYDSTGALLGQTADQSSSWTSSGFRSMNIITPFAVAGGSYVWLAYLVGSASTLPLFTRSVAGAALNFGTRTGTTRRNADYGSAQTSLPGPLTLASLADSTRVTWWAVS